MQYYNGARTAPSVRPKRQLAMLQRADDALYAAKAAGRNCSAFYERLGDETDSLDARLASWW
jgi:predicted signal transduction protein with EAL and GGDEF domain